MERVLTANDVYPGMSSEDWMLGILNSPINRFFYKRLVVENNKEDLQEYANSTGHSFNGIVEGIWTGITMQHENCKPTVDEVVNAVHFMFAAVDTKDPSVEKDIPREFDRCLFTYRIFITNCGN